MFKAVLFDLDRTIFNIDIPEKEALTHVHKTYIDPQINCDQFIAAYKKENEKWWYKRSRNEASLNDVRHNSMTDALNALNTEISVSVETLYMAYANKAQEYWQMYNGALESIARLREKGLKTAIITNGFSVVQRVKIKQMNLEPYFDFFTISDEVNMAKPSAEIFHFTLEKLGVSAGESLYVGDNLHDDYNGAKNAAIPFLWFNEHGQENHVGGAEFSDYENLLPAVENITLEL